MDKPAWRSWAKTQRQSLPMTTLSGRICANLVQWPLFQNAHTILSFMALPTEVDLTALWHAHPDKKWYFPRITPEGPMAFGHVTPNAALIQSKWGILEPTEEAPTLPEGVSGYLILIPALAVDTQGVRLGYGKGYYDQFIATHAIHAIRVCPVPQALVVPQLPRDPWDVPVQFIVSETGIAPCPAPSVLP